MENMGPSGVRKTGFTDESSDTSMNMVEWTWRFGVRRSIGLVFSAGLNLPLDPCGLWTRKCVWIHPGLWLAIPSSSKDPS
ncbi:hypothetical protein AG1IA_03213 [Rhizoctonia solani AG-1 IA]|uniref:Uncharacterized protein n=1 Tax=Thanatephorus cucumeris (strain AG1-IA) TaxID=983506 RepID=L8X0Z3_THACA|nr:hypothetical protein AG1IA_03213 [Rhizoctonia solani AG-1 IA]